MEAIDTLYADNVESVEAVAMEGMDSQMVQANNDVAVWLIDGFTPGRLAQGAMETAMNGAVPYAASSRMGLMHTALGNNVADFLTGAKDARTTLADIEAEYLTSAREAGLVQ